MTAIHNVGHRNIYAISRDTPPGLISHIEPAQIRHDLKGHVEIFSQASHCREPLRLFQQAGIYQAHDTHSHTTLPASRRHFSRHWQRFRHHYAIRHIVFVYRQIPTIADLESDYSFCFE
jgi:hypothetical protein